MNTNWEYISQLYFTVERFETEQRNKRIRRLCDVGIGVVWLSVAVAIAFLIHRHFEHQLPAMAQIADQQLILDDGKQVLVVPTPGHGEPFTFPTLKKR